MEATIARGRILREILKQDRLAPLSVVCQMAWLVAFNNGRFEGVEPETIGALLDVLQRQSQHTTLTLDSPREQWSNAVADWLPGPAPEANP